MKTGPWRLDGECSNPANNSSVLVKHVAIRVCLLTYTIDDIAFKKLANWVALFVEDQASLVHFETV